MQIEGKVETYKESVSIDDENTTVHLIEIEYEKRNKDVPDQQKYLN